MRSAHNGKRRRETHLHEKLAQNIIFGYFSKGDQKLGWFESRLVWKSRYIHSTEKVNETNKFAEFLSIFNIVYFIFRIRHISQMNRASNTLPNNPLLHHVYSKTFYPMH